MTATAATTRVDAKYTQLTPIEHILMRPGMYIGQTTRITEHTFVCDAVCDATISKRYITYSPGLHKIFDEVVSNALDHALENAEVTQIKVSIDATVPGKESFTVFNNGPGISSGVHADSGIHIPELIFGNLHTGSNYTDTRTGIGMNGLGVKLTNIFSKVFVVETVHDGDKYMQTFTENMSTKTKPSVKRVKTAKDYTKVSWTPDYSIFGAFDSDVVAKCFQRTMDLTVCTPTTVFVFWNGKKIPAKTFKEYITKLYGLSIIAHETSPDQNWEYAVCKSPTDSFESVAFVNGIRCVGRHVDYITNQIVSKLRAALEARKKCIVKPGAVKERLILFLVCRVENPEFNSQTKETLVGYKFKRTNGANGTASVEVSDAFVAKLYCSEVISDLVLEVKTLLANSFVRTDRQVFDVRARVGTKTRRCCVRRN